MKKASSYIGSFLVTILLIFSLIGTFGIQTANSFTREKAHAIAEEKQLSAKIYTELERYFRERKNTTGIPENVYMDALTEDYITKLMNAKIDEGFDSLSGKINDSLYDKNTKLEESIMTFYSDYADSIGYKKDEKYYRKLNAAIESAYKIIKEYCDVYKFGALSKHGVLGKVSKVYGMLPMAFWLCIIADAVLMLLLLVINIKELRSVLYWIATGSLISGLIGLVPSIYLLSSNYFGSFTIKQPQIYTAYTSAMTYVTQHFMYIAIGAVAVGIVMYIGYGFSSVIGKKSDEKPSESESEAKTE